MSRLYLILCVSLVALAVFVPSSAQQLAKRLILKDGTFQLATQWEVKGDRVRYLSAERNEWEELPNSLVDWDATEKFEKDRVAGVPSPEAVEVDKEMAAERAAEEAKTPLVAPGLHLPEDGSILLLDTYQNEPQLVELQQNGGELNRNRKQNILRAAINPIAGGKETIELTGPHASIQAHASLPSIYVNLAQSEGSGGGPQQPQQAFDRFHIVRMRAKNDKRVVGEVKISPTGKSSQEQSVVQTTCRELTGGWVKVTPVSPLDPGEYAVVEVLGQEGINTYVWDFGVNPSAAANAGVLKPDESSPPSDKSKDPQPAKPQP
jgi:hypothetical protein